MVSTLHVMWPASDSFLQKSPRILKVSGLSVLMTSSLATLLQEEGKRQMGINTTSTAPFFLEEILKDCYAENFFNKLILQTFKGWLLD